MGFVYRIGISHEEATVGESHDLDRATASGQPQ